MDRFVDKESPSSFIYTIDIARVIHRVYMLVDNLTFEMQTVAMIQRQYHGKSSRNNTTSQQFPNSLSCFHVISLYFKLLYCLNPISEHNY